MVQKERNVLWDLWCITSIVGIWPRFIEPNLLFTTKLKLGVPHLPPSLKGLKILQFSDLHLNPNTTSTFIDKLHLAAKQFAPDLILFSGDFLCYSLLGDEERLKTILQGFSAPYGCYAILGNHDYAEAVSINEEGEYDIIVKPKSSLERGFKRLLRKTPPLKCTVTERAKGVGLHAGLLRLLEETPFKLLHNASALIPVKDSYLNICGLGEYMLNRCQPEIAFKTYDRRYPGIILVHNPDAVPHLKDYPGDIILCGHTHGAQIDLPWFRSKFSMLENPQFLRGLKRVGNKWLYVNRGIGSVFPFRWFAPPEVVLLTLEEQQDDQHSV